MKIVQKVMRRLQKQRSKLSSSSSLSTSSRCTSSWESSDWNDLSDSDGDDCQACCTTLDYAPVDVPEGYLAVYVGEKRTRCVMNARHLSHPWFKSLLQKSAEEFGFHHNEGLVLLCELVTFERMIQKLENDS